ncbi:MAG: hypothetical protein WAK55_28400, partial [Xanthobacteraceae bacterium]
DGGQTLGELQSAGKHALCRRRYAALSHPEGDAQSTERQIGNRVFLKPYYVLYGETLTVLR